MRLVRYDDKRERIAPFLIRVAEQSRGKQNSKIKMQNDRAKGKIPMTKTVLNFEFRVSHIGSYKNPSKSPFRKGGVRGI